MADDRPVAADEHGGCNLDGKSPSALLTCTARIVAMIHSSFQIEPRTYPAPVRVECSLISPGPRTPAIVPLVTNTVRASKLGEIIRRQRESGDLRALVVPVSRGFGVIGVDPGVPE